MSSTFADRPIRIATVGLGFGTSVHVPGILELENVEFIGLVGRDKVKTEDSLRDLGIDTSLALTSLDEVLLKKPDILTLALPPSQNEQVVLKALNSECSIFCEKPLSISYESAQRMVQASQHKKTCVGFQFAELPVFKILSKVFKSGNCGQIKHVNVTWLVESYVQKNNLWTWKSNLHEGGGVMAMLGSHLLYLAELFFGEVTKVWASYDNTKTTKFSPSPDFAAEDLIHIYMEHVSGVKFSAIVGNSCPGISYHRWDVVAENGVLLLENPTKDYMNGFCLKGFGGLSKIQWQDTFVGNLDGRIKPFKHMLNSFISSIYLDEKKSIPSFKDGARVQLLMNAIRSWANTNKTILLKQS